MLHVPQTDLSGFLKHSKVGINVNGIIVKTYFFAHRFWSAVSWASDSAIHDGDGSAAVCHTKFTAGSYNWRRLGPNR